MEPPGVRLGLTRGPHFKHNCIAFQETVILGSGPLSDYQTKAGLILLIELDIWI